MWRRPVAFAGYGVLGALVLVLIFGGGEDDAAAERAEIEQVALDEAPTAPRRSATATREAFTLASYERLLAEGQSAVGEVVRAELFCGSITPVATRQIEGQTSPIDPLKDAEGRVAGAECRWSRDARTSDFLLIVPPDLAEEFARAPEVEMDFVQRRVIPADVEWLGRSEVLALRTAGVLRNIR